MSGGLDRARVDARLERIEELCEHLDAAAAMAPGAFIASEDRVAATERRLQVAVQAAIDVAAHVAAANAWRMGEGYAAVFTGLGSKGLLPGDLAVRLARAAGLRNLLVHDYLEVDPRRLHAALAADAADLRAFVGAVARWMAG